MEGKIAEIIRGLGGAGTAIAIGLKMFSDFQGPIYPAGPNSNKIEM